MLSEAELLRTFVEYTPAAVAIFDRDMRYLAASASWRETFGLDADILGKAHDALVPELPENWRLAHRRALEGARLLQQTGVFRNAQGAERRLSWSLQPWRDASGGIGGVAAFVQDMTALEGSLQATQLDLARAQEVGQMGSWRLDTRRNILTWSDENYRIFERAPGSALSYEDFLDCVHPDDRRYVDEKWRAALGGAPYDIEHRLLVGGRVKWVREKAYLEFDDMGLLIGGYGITQDITDLMLAQEALRESVLREKLRAAELKTVFDTAPIGLSIATDPTGRHIQGNRANEEMFGLPPGAELSKTAAQPIPVRMFEDDRELAPEELPMQRALREGVEVSRVLDAVREDGRRLTLFGKAAPLFDDQGNTRGAVGAFLDITALKQAEAALKATRDTFRDVVRNSPFGIFVVDADLLLWEVSLGAERSFSNSRMLIGCNFADVLRAIWPEAAAEEAMGRFRDALATAKPFHAPTIMQRRRDTGEVESYDWQIERIKLPDGRFGVVCNFYDLSERQRYEQQLQESEERFRAIFEHAGTGIAITDMEGKFEQANPVYCDYVGYSLDELRVINFAELIHPDDRETNISEIRRLQVCEQPYFEIENRYIRKDGESIWVHKYVSLLRDARGKPAHIVALVSDVTERRLMEQALRDVDRRKDEFLATLAHELRNPLAPVHNAVQILKKIGGFDDRVGRVLEMADRQVQHLVRLVDDLMDVSRISRGKIELRKERIDLRSALSMAVETSDPNLRVKQHSLRVDAPSAPVFAEADPVRIVQIVANLLNNAARYTDTGGSIELSLRSEGAWAVIRVRDNGKGISPEILPSIFEPFTQGSCARGGLGLGLALARALVVLHGGVIEARSAGQGKGAEFVVRLPLIAPERPREAPQTASTRRALVVDDDRDVADSLVMLLRTSGATAEAAYDGVEALAQLPALKPDIVFLDISMPGLDGYETARRLRQMPEGRNVMLVALTGWGQEDPVRATGARFDKQLVKPADPDALLELLELAPAQEA